MGNAHNLFKVKILKNNLRKIIHVLRKKSIIASIIPLTLKRLNKKLDKSERAYSSVGRAPVLHTGGHRFESFCAHVLLDLKEHMRG